MLAIQEFLARYGISEFGKYGYEIILVSILLFATIVMVLERRCLNIFKARCVSVPKTGYLDVDGEDDDTEYHANNITEDPDISTHLNSIGQISYIWDRLSDDDMIKRSKEFYRLMDKRRTIRYFSSEPVPKEAIEAILRTAGTSPSGAHQQPWSYVVVTSPSVKQAIRQIVEYEEEINYKKRMAREWVDALKPINVNWIKPYIDDAPYIILVFKQLYSRNSDGVRQAHYYSEHGTSISVGILLAAIHNAGLYALTSTPLNCGSAISNLLARPENEKLVYLIPVGLPSSDCTVPNLVRKSMQQFVTFV